jgi:hypothetical protein
MSDTNRDLEVTNPRKQIQKNYARWVDNICEECDWKTSISMDEVQAVYSRLAIELSIKELSRFSADSAVSERIRYLQSLLND